MVFVIFLFVFSGQITINIRVLLNINRFHKRTKKPPQLIVKVSMTRIFSTIRTNANAFSHLPSYRNDF